MGPANTHLQAEIVGELAGNTKANAGCEREGRALDRDIVRGEEQTDPAFCKECPLCVLRFVVVVSENELGIEAKGIFPFLLVIPGCKFEGELNIIDDKSAPRCVDVITSVAGEIV